MIKLELLNDDDLQDVLTRCLSGLLPHENYDQTYFLPILQMVTRYVELESMEMEFYGLFKILLQYSRLKNSFGTSYTPQLTREVLFNYLLTGVASLVTDKHMKVKSFLQKNGLDANLEVPATFDATCKIVSTRVLELYDEAYRRAIPSGQVVAEEPILKQAYLNHVSTLTMNIQRDILTSEVKINRKLYSGCEDWLSFSNNVMREITNKINNTNNSKYVSMDTMDTAQGLLNDLKSFSIPIAEYGIPELDDATPILQHRMVVVVGKENVGKTKFAVDQAVNVIRSGHKVVFMCGETHKSAIFADILINYIWKEFHISITTQDITNLENLAKMNPDIAAKIMVAIDTLTNSQNLILHEAFSYDTVYEELESMYEETGFHAVFIDHSCALAGTVGDGTEKAKVGALSEAVRRFRKDYPVYIMVTSHPSSSAKNSDAEGKETTNSPTRGSQNLSADADDVFYLRDNPTLKKQGLIILENTKRRNAARLTEYVYLRKRFSVSTFEYRAEDQSRADQMSTEESAILDELTSFSISSYL